MDFSSLETLDYIRFEQTHLNNLSFPNLKYLRNLEFVDNQFLTEINLPNLENVGNGNLNSWSNFTISNNHALTHIDLANLSKIFGRLNIINNNMFDVSTINNCDFFVYSTMVTSVFGM